VPHTPSPLVLPSSLTLTEPTRRLLAFCREEYAYYDAIPSADPNAIEPIDVLVTVAMNSFINNAALVRSVHQGMAEACDPLLAEIPQHSDLLDEDFDSSGVERLLDAACQVPQVQLARATKVLHRKRRSLIPMMDSVLNDYYLTSLGGGRRAASVATVVLGAFRDDLRAVVGDLRTIGEDVRSQGYDPTPLRMLEVLVGTEVEPQGYYRTSRHGHHSIRRLCGGSRTARI